MQTNTPPEKPVPPFVVIGPRGELKICDSDSELGRASLYGLVRGFFSGLTAYDSIGSRWHVAEVICPYRVTFWTCLLAKTVYNPRFTVMLRWQRDGAYEFSELQEAMRRLVDKDDDILTQFVPAERLKKLITLCSTYDQLVAKLRKHKAVQGSA